MNLEAKFPVECIGDVFRHLSGKELLKGALVCPTWNSFILSTKSCMEKIKFNIRYIRWASSWYKKDDYHRRLERRKWRNVFLGSCNFGSTEKFLEVFEIFLTSPELHSKVTEFKISLMKKDLQEQKLSLSKFLKTQRNTLKVVNLTQRVSVAALHIVFSMPHLEKLYVGSYDYDHLDLEAQTFQQNNSITTLRLMNYLEKNTAVLLKAAPNVEILSIESMGSKLAVLIPKTCKSLKRFKVEHLVAITNENFFLDLENFDCYLVTATRISQEILMKIESCNL